MALPCSADVTIARPADLYGLPADVYMALAAQQSSSGARVARQRHQGSVRPLGQLSHV